MGPDVPPGGSRPRVGLVLGAGGVLGAAWMTGALPALQERLPCPLAGVDLVVGTSAGSVLAAALRCGVSIEEMIAHQRGEAIGVLADAGVGDVTGGPWPPPPALRVGSPRLLLTSLLTPHRVHPGVGASAWVLRGRGSPPGPARHGAAAGGLGVARGGHRCHGAHPGPEDLAVMGANLMDPRRRRAVLETSLRTSAATFAGTRQDRPEAA